MTKPGRSKSLERHGVCQVVNVKQLEEPRASPQGSGPDEKTEDAQCTGCHLF